MTRDEAYQLLTKHLSNKNLIKHSLAAEAAMKAIYKHITPEAEQNNNDVTKWGITGLLHDVDYEHAQNEDKLDHHGTFIGVPEKADLPEDIAHAIQSHAYEYSKVMPESSLDWGITAADQLTGLITACALVRPDKKLASVDTAAVMKKFGQKAFAAGADREMIKHCESKLDIPLETFVDIVLHSMQDIHEDLGL